MAGEKEGDGFKKTTGEVLGQKRSSPFYKMTNVQLAVAGAVLVGAAGYYMYYWKPKRESAARQQK